MAQDSSDSITVSKAQLQEMIQEALAAQQPAAAPAIMNTEQLTAIGSAVAAGLNKHTRPKVSYGDYARRPHSSTHPDPAYPNGPALTRETWVNGHREEQHVLTDKEIHLFNRLSRTGRFLNRLWEVQVSADVVDIRYNNRTVDQRNELMEFGKKQIQQLEAVVAEMDELNAIDADEVEQKVEARRRFGNSKASREAREKAGVA